MRVYTSSQRCALIPSTHTRAHPHTHTDTHDKHSKSNFPGTTTTRKKSARAVSSSSNHSPLSILSKQVPRGPWHSPHWPGPDDRRHCRTQTQSLEPVHRTCMEHQTEQQPHCDELHRSASCHRPHPLCRRIVVAAAAGWPTGCVRCQVRNWLSLTSEAQPSSCRVTAPVPPNRRRWTAAGWHDPAGTNWGMRPNPPVSRELGLAKARGTCYQD